MRLLHAGLRDFEWVNANLLQGAFERTTSLFDNSDLRPRGVPTPAELALLNPLKAQLPPEVFGEPYKPFVTDGTGADRRPVREALRLLDEAGFKVAGGKMVDPAKRTMINADAKLKAVVGVSPISMFGMTKEISKHLK